MPFIKICACTWEEVRVRVEQDLRRKNQLDLPVILRVVGAKDGKHRIVQATRFVTLISNTGQPLGQRLDPIIHASEYVFHRLQFVAAKLPPVP